MMKISLALLSTLSLSLMSLSCSKDDDDGDKIGSISNFALTKDDLAPQSNIKAYNESQVKEAVETSRPLANETLEADEDSDPCFDALTAAAFIPTITGSTMRINTTIDGSACIRKSFDNTGVVVSRAIAAFSVDITYDCTGKDLSSLAGKALSDDFNAEAYCDQGFKGKANSKSVVDLAYTFQGQAVASNTTSISATSTADNEACTITANGATRTNASCIEIEKHIATGSEADSSYKKLVYSNLVWTPSASDEFYTSGTMNATFNDWTGVITFAGATTPPNYSMTKAGATVTGTIPLATTNLRSSLKKEFAFHRKLALKAMTRSN